MYTRMMKLTNQSGQYLELKNGFERHEQFRATVAMCNSTVNLCAIVNKYTLYAKQWRVLHDCKNCTRLIGRDLKNRVFYLEVEKERVRLEKQLLYPWKKF